MSEQLSEHISVQTAQMAQVLVKIVNDKYQWIEERKTKQPLASFHPLLTRSERDFYQALSGDNTVFILECKKPHRRRGLSAKRLISITSPPCMASTPMPFRY